MSDQYNCELTVLGDKETLQAFETKANGNVQKYVGETQEQEVLSFHQLYPVPKKFTVTYYTEDSYRWEKRHWGCKHGASYTKIVKKTDDSIVYSLVVNSLPINWLKKVSRDYADLVFYLDFEDDCQRESGRCVVENGVLFEQGGDI